MMLKQMARCFESWRVKSLGLFLLSVPLSATALPLADTQGRVAAVRVVSDQSGGAAFEVWFSSTTRDRYGCLAANGYITVREANFTSSPENYSRIFAIALASQAAGKELALDSSGTDPCFQVSIAWMVD